MDSGLKPGMKFRLGCMHVCDLDFEVISRLGYSISSVC